MTPIPVTRITEDTPDSELIRLLRHRTPFRNSRGTFRGTRVTPLQASHLWFADPVVKHLTKEARLALMLDEPDYVVWSRDVPIAWHSTTRGIDHRKDQSNWRWVVASVAVWPDYATQRRFNRMVVIVDVLNQQPKRR